MTGDADTRSEPVGESDDEGIPGMSSILDLTFDGDSLYALRSAVEAHVIAAGMPQGRAEDVVIAVHELATNAVRHGAGAGRLRIWRIPGVLRCRVEDEGPPGDALQAKDSNFADEWPCKHGHGLWLIRHTADAMSLSSGPDGTRAVLSFTLPPPGPRPGLSLDRRSERGCAVLGLGGDLDRRAGPELISAFTHLITGTREPPRMILDLERLAFWDSAGIAALVTLQRHVDVHPSAALVIANAPGRLRFRLADTSLVTGLTLADGLDEAVAMATSQA
jgi:anti-anti-sigma factor